MNDETKEILDLLNFNRDTISNGICRVEDFMSREQIIKLLDYITNLQQENEKLKELCDKYEEEHNTAFKLWKMKMEEIPTYEEKEDYKKRIDKAIEFTEPFIEWGECTINGKILKQISDILKGDSNE